MECADKWMNLEKIILNDINNTQKDKCDLCHPWFLVPNPQM